MVYAYVSFKYVSTNLGHKQTILNGACKTSNIYENAVLQMYENNLSQVAVSYVMKFI